VTRVSSGSVRLDNGQSLGADIVINATGHECGRLLRQSGLGPVPVQPDKGTILVTERRVCAAVVSRLRMPADGDIVVPGHTTSLIGTTSSRSEDTLPARDEYRRLLREAIALLPALNGVRIIRAFSGIRPLLGEGEGRALSRDFSVSEQSGVLTVAGGKLTTYRLIAEQAADAAMKIMGEHGRCQTRTAPLPDIRREVPDDVECRCESAGRRIVEMDFLRGADLSKYNRLGFGTCQGMRCAKHASSPEAFLQERWRGVRPALDESQLRQAYVSWAALRTRGR
jgi:glycerol-3-phosphate dehydrogenase